MTKYTLGYSNYYPHPPVEEFPEGGVNFMGWKFHGRTYVRGKFPGVNVP